MLALTIPPYNIFWVSVSFFVLFVAYNGLQNVLTTVLPAGLGNQSLGILYGSVGITIFFASPCIRLLGTKGTMILGGLLYVAYMCTLVHIEKAAVLAMSAVIGFGAAVMWVALGVFIKENSTPDNYGWNTGAFWCIFQLSNVLGNVLVYTVLSQIQVSAPFFAIVAGVGAAGTAGLFLLRRPPKRASQLHLQAPDSSLAPSHSRHGPQVLVAARAFCKHTGYAVVDILSMLKDRRVLCMLPLQFFSGLELSFWSGEFPLLLRDASVVGLVETFAGIGEVVGGLTFGKICDTCGRMTALVIGCALFSTGLGLSAWLKQCPEQAPVLAGAPLIAYVAALCFGLGDSAFNTILFSGASAVFDEPDAVPGFASGAAGAADHGATLAAFAAVEVDASTAVAARGTDSTLTSKLAADESAAPAGASQNDTESLRTHLLESDQAVAGRAAAATVCSVRAPLAASGTPFSASGGLAETERAMAIFQLVQNCGSACGFAGSPNLPLHGPSGTYALLYIQGGLMAASLLGFLLMPKRAKRAPSAAAIAP